MNNSEQLVKGQYMALVGSAGMGIGLAIASLIDAFIFPPAGSLWIIGGPIGMGIAMLVYSLIIGKGESK